MEEIWEEVTLDKEFYDNYVVTEFIQNSEGTTIILLGDNNEIQIHFSSVTSVCVTDEGGRLNTYFNVPELQKYRETFYGNPMYTVKNSKYVQWIEKEAVGFSDGFNHYVFVTRDDIVDVIAVFPPKIKKVVI